MEAVALALAALSGFFTVQAIRTYLQSRRQHTERKHGR